MLVEQQPPQDYEGENAYLLPPSWLWRTTQDTLEPLTSYNEGHFSYGEIFTITIPGYVPNNDDELDDYYESQVQMYDIVIQEVIYTTAEGEEYIGYIELDGDTPSTTPYQYFGSEYGFSSEVFSPAYHQDHTNIELVDVSDVDGKGQLTFEFSDELQMIIDQSYSWQGFYVTDRIYLEDGYLLTHPIFNYDMTISSTTSGQQVVQQDGYSSNLDPTTFVYQLDHSIYDAPIDVTVTTEIVNPFEDVVSSYENPFYTEYEEKYMAWVDDLNENFDYDISYESSDSYSFDLTRQSSHNIDMSLNGEQQTITMPAYYDNGEVVNESITFTNLTAGETTYPEPVSDILEIQINTPSPTHTLSIDSATVSFNNGNPPVEVDLRMDETSPGVYTVSVEGNYYYDHTTQEVVNSDDYYPDNGHHYEVFIDELPTPLDSEDVISTIDFTVTSDTYTEVEYNMSIDVKSNEKIRNGDEAMFNIELTEGEFDTDNMTHLASMDSMKHISQLADEYISSLNIKR